MSRADIGNYLGLTVETVSRVFGRFQKQDILLVDKKEIEVLDIDQLRKLAN
jgi:CRP/FNR family transcriptional regulator